MMKIPKGRPVHKELSSSFVDLAKLVEELKGNSFSGVIELVGLKTEAEVLLDNGTIANIWIRGETTLLGRQHLDFLIGLARQENLLISTFLLPPEAVAFLAGFLGTDPIYENLSSDFTDPKKLIGKFEDEEGEFLVEAIFQKNLGSGLLFMQDGHVVEGLMSLLGKDLTTGKGAIREIVEAARELGAVFHVYKGNLASIASINVPPRVEPAALAGMVESLIRQFLALVPGEFWKIHPRDPFVRECCLAIADQHPFLDPFAAEFHYRKGQLEFAPKDPPAEVMAGITALLQQMLDRLAGNKTGYPLEKFRQSVSETMAAEHPAASQAAGIPDLINSLAADR